MDECDRVFCDKLATAKDKESYGTFIDEIGNDVFGQELYTSACSEPKYMVSFLRDDVYDEDEILVEEAPKVYEDGGSLECRSSRPD